MAVRRGSGTMTLDQMATTLRSAGWTVARPPRRKNASVPVAEVVVTIAEWCNRLCDWRPAQIKKAWIKLAKHASPSVARDLLWYADRIEEGYRIPFRAAKVATAAEFDKTLWWIEKKIQEVRH